MLVNVSIDREDTVTRLEKMRKLVELLNVHRVVLLTGTKASGKSAVLCTFEHYIAFQYGEDAVDKGEQKLQVKLKPVNNWHGINGDEDLERVIPRMFDEPPEGWVKFIIVDDVHSAYTSKFSRLWSNVEKLLAKKETRVRLLMTTLWSEPQYTRAVPCVLDHRFLYFDTLEMQEAAAGFHAYVKFEVPKEMRDYVYETSGGRPWLVNELFWRLQQGLRRLKPEYRTYDVCVEELSKPPLGLNWCAGHISSSGNFFLMNSGSYSLDTCFETGYALLGRLLADGVVPMDSPNSATGAVQRALIRRGLIAEQFEVTGFPPQSTSSNGESYVVFATPIQRNVSLKEYEQHMIEQRDAEKTNNEKLARRRTSSVTSLKVMFKKVLGRRRSSADTVD
ncbi:hypothetical protein HDU85_001163 [Gaertneriomyces sp. JEL0708]|nr:hypothetical protein HDU85_001163 [Gaertneriomyces sp. JEL0708]